jgi:hypothetical protein
MAPHVPEPRQQAGQALPSLGLATIKQVAQHRAETVVFAFDLFQPGGLLLPAYFRRGAFR